MCDSHHRDTEAQRTGFREAASTKAGRLFAAASAVVFIAAGAWGQDRVWRHISSKRGELPVPNGGQQQTACVVFDIDDDRKTDIVIGERTLAPALIWLRRTAAGWAKYVIDGTHQRPEAGGVGYDVDNDSDLDLIIGGDSQSSELWWYENPSPRFDPAAPWKRHFIKKEGGRAHHDQAIGDFKGTAKPQLVFWNQGAKKLFLADIPDDPKELGSWPCVEIWSYAELPGGMKQEGMAVIDLDRDGKPDLLAGNHWFKHVRGNNFKAIQFAPTGGRVASAYFKRGPYPQIVVAPGDGTGPLMLYECQGPPADPAAWKGRDLLGKPVVHGHSLEIADLDDDGHMDIFCAEMAKWTESRREPDHPKAKAWILYGDGKAAFKVTELATGMGFHEARLIDLNADGRLDILNKPYNWDAPRLDGWLNPGR